MNGNRQMEMHYINTGFPYTATEGFVELFQGITPVPLDYSYPAPLHHHQENAYWSMNMNAYKFGFSDPGSTSYYGAYEVNDSLPTMDFRSRFWEFPSALNTEEPTTADIQSEGDAVMGITNNPSADSHTSSPQGAWQDDIDPDNMTYEELLDLGETVGTESRGLSQELISLLPISKCKFGNIFSRKKSGERCVICQMRYKRGDKQIKLPCKHLYHSECITKWLGVNKVCPVCNNEVFGKESRN